MQINTKPNVLFIIADDHAANAISALGHSTVQTPTLDRLVREGTTLSDCRIMGSLIPAVCAPSRACLLTGQDLFSADSYAHLNPRPSNEVPIPKSCPLLPELFRKADYETYLVGKWHNDADAALRGFTQGSNIFMGGMCSHTSVPVNDLAGIASGTPSRIAEGFSSEIFCQQAAEDIRQHDPSSPFFMWLALTSPHDPRTPPPPYDTLYDPEKMPLPENFLPEHPFDNGELEIRDEKLAPKPRTPERIRRELADYYGMIAHHDACLAQVLEALETSGQMDNTIIVYVADHGLALGQHGLLGKQNLYEHSVRVPLLLRGPKIPADLRSKRTVYSLDLYASLCELAGISFQHPVVSRSFVPQFNLSSKGNQRESFFATYRRFQNSVYNGEWKLIRYTVSEEVVIQLFNLKEDPHEQINRAEDPTCAMLRDELLEALQIWEKSHEFV